MSLVRILVVVCVLATSVSWVRPETKDLRIRGRIACLDAEGQLEPCSDESRNFALDAIDGERYFFSASDEKTKMFWDERVRSQLLEVRVWLEDGRQATVIKVYSVKQGKLFDVHYYCAICSITAYAGGPCWCCQEEFEFRETPVE